MLSEILLFKLVFEAGSRRVVSFHDLNELLSRHLFSIKNLAFLEHVDCLRDIESDVLLQRIRSLTTLREVLEDLPQLSLVFLEDRLGDFEVFLIQTTVTLDTESLSFSVIGILPPHRQSWPCFYQRVASDYSRKGGRASGKAC